MKKCDHCNKEIPEKRLKIFPETNICSANCAQEIKDSHESIQKQIVNNKELEEQLYNSVSGPYKSGDSKYFKKFKDKFPKELESKLKELSEKKYTTNIAYNDFKNKKISKDEYKIKFKKFTWWIKEKVENMGGKLVDNPANYIECEECGNLTLVQWTPKFQKYFLGCSNFKNGCSWVKTIWIM